MSGLGGDASGLRYDLGIPFLKFVLLFEHGTRHHEVVIRSSSALAPTGVFLALALATGGLSGVETTGSAAVSAGSMDSDSGLNFEGAYAIMLGSGFGFQIDGMQSSIGTTEFAGGGLQAFWQNDSPWLASLGLASVHGELVESQELSSGIQFQQSWYSIGAKVGYAQVAYDGTVPFIDDKDNSLLMEIHADFYASDTLRASLGVEHRFDLVFAKTELEWLTPVDGLSLFANCMVGENQYDHALVGLRYYFGGDNRSLKGRRETPRPMSSGVLYGMGNHGALYNSRGRKFAAANPSAGFSGGGTYGSLSLSNGGSFNYGSIDYTSGGTLIIVNPSTGLGGTGVVGGGNLTVGGGTLLGPGSSPVGQLTLSNNYTLANGGGLVNPATGTPFMIPDGSGAVSAGNLFMGDTPSALTPESSFQSFGDVGSQFLMSFPD